MAIPSWRSPCSGPEHGSDRPPHQSRRFYLLGSADVEPRGPRRPPRANDFDAPSDFCGVSARVVALGCGPPAPSWSRACGSPGRTAPSAWRRRSGGAGPAPAGVGRLPRLLRPERPPRPRALHPLRAAHDRRGLRRPGQGADRAGAGVPPGRLLRRGAPRPAPGHPGGRGQELLLPLRRGLPRAAAGGPEDGGAAPWPRGGRAAGLRLRFPQGGSTLTQQLVRGYFLRDRDEPRERRRPLPRRLCPAAPRPRPWASRPRTSSSGSWRRCAWRSGSRRRCAGATDRRSRPSARSSPATPASSTWATAATASPPAPSTTSASPCRATRSADAGEGGAAGGDQQVAQGLRPGARQSAAPAPPQRDPGPDGAQRVHPRGPREALPGRAGPRGGPQPASRPTPPPRSTTSSTS